MKKRVSLVVSATALLMALSMFTIFNDVVHAEEIEDGTYEIEYEMKEADNDNTSIANGYFTSPATLTVDDDNKRVRLTVTSAHMVKSLSAPTGDVDVVEEDEEEETRTVKFRVDQDLSEPLPLEMHVVVPDLYDTTHIARAVFDIDSMKAVSDDQKISSIEDIEDNDQTETENINDNNEANENAENDNNAEPTDQNNENTEAGADENVSAADTDTEAASEEGDGSLTALWITLAVIGVIVIVAIIFWISRKKQKA